MNIDTAEAIRVAQDWDTGIVLDVANELVGPSGDDKVDVFVLVK